MVIERDVIIAGLTGVFNTDTSCLSSADVKPIEPIEYREEVISREKQMLPLFRPRCLDQDHARTPPAPVASFDHFSLVTFDVDFQKVDRPIDEGLADLGKSRRAQGTDRLIVSSPCLRNRVAISPKKSPNEDRTEIRLILASSHS